MDFAVLLAWFAVALLFGVLWSHLKLRPAAQGPPPALPPTLPSVTVIRPIRGVDTGARENLRAALEVDYPGKVETIFVLDDEREPALPMVRDAIREHGGRARLLFAGTPPAGRTGKLNAMIAGLRAARGELVAFADSDIRPGREVLADLVATLCATPGAGAAFAPVVVAGRPRTAGDAGYALLLNGLYGAPADLLARRSDGALPFIMGQFMVVRREALAAIGGLECAEGQLVDDMYLGTRLHAAGYRNAVAHRRIPIHASGLSARAFSRIFLRWIAFGRSGLPVGSKASSLARGLLFWVGLVAAIASAWRGWWWAAALNALVPIGIAASIQALHRDIGGTRLALRHAWVSFAIVLCAPAIYLRLFLRPEIEWRGRRYRLDIHSRLADRSMTEDGLAVAWNHRRR
jgi:ceramide glucosyltransferase